MIQIKTQLSQQQFDQLCAAICERFPAIVGQVQAINAAGQFRLAPVRGGTMPAGLTVQTVETMLANIQANRLDIHAGTLWAGAVNRRYARRVRR